MGGQSHYFVGKDRRNLESCRFYGRAFTFAPGRRQRRVILFYYHRSIS